MKWIPRDIFIALTIIAIVLLSKSALAQDIYSVTKVKTGYNAISEHQFRILAQHQLEIVFYLLTAYRDSMGVLPKDFNELHKSPFFVCDLTNFSNGKPLRPDTYVANAGVKISSTDFINPDDISGQVGSYVLNQLNVNRVQLIMFGPNSYRYELAFEKEYSMFIANFKARNELKYSIQDTPFLRSAVLLEQYIPRFGMQSAYWFNNISLKNRYWVDLQPKDLVKLANNLNCYPLNAYTGQLIGYTDTYKIGEIYTGPGILADRQIYYCVSYGRVRSLKELDDPKYYRQVAKLLVQRDKLTMEQAKANKSPLFFNTLKGVALNKAPKKEKKPVVPYK